MNIFPVERVLKLLESGDIGSVNENPVFKMQRQMCESMLRNLSLRPSKSQYKEVAEFITDNTDIVIDSQQAKTLLKVYPEARLSVYLHGVKDTDTGGQVLDVVANFFLACNWPSGENFFSVAENYKFHTALSAQAKALGYDIRE